MQIHGIDTAHHLMLRKRLVEEVRHKGITDEEVLAALEVIPRHFFVNTSQREFAYLDRPAPIGEGQTISQPYTVAYQTELLNVSPSDKILEIGTGSAYQACVLAQMGAEVFTIERQKKLFDKYQNSPYLHKFKNIHFFYGDGHNGLPAFAPFDKILITAAASSVPPALLDQLKPGGSLVLPLGPVEQSQMMVRITKSTDGTLLKEAFNQFNFVPMLEGTRE
ncbi:MAG TPA: protein-L-isoaspartate(D-aspartate) O-methyltransferase [Chitinophagaceae bacterium]|nr:protein-L-isoaspartate(D-aspartate) O-methyltransferase [Chitinophagaceae bacterium]